MKLREVEVIAVTPAWHVDGQRMVKVEFGGEEFADIATIKKDEKITATIQFDPRGITAPKNPIYIILTLFIPYQEWIKMKRRYAVGDKYTLAVSTDGTINLKKLKS
jgi:hypothetical protein